MTEFDPLKTDTYARHLAAVNETHTVIATEDIRNAAGILVAKKGIKLEKNITDKILQHRLLKPLQDCVKIDQALDGERLYSYMLDWLKRHQDLNSIHEQLNMDRILKALCNHYQKFTTLHQLTTVLLTQLPDVFQRACFVAWLAAAIAQRRKLSVEDTIIAFVGGLCHDIGLLHLPPEILSVESQHKPNEWRMYQVHTVIGQKIIQAIPGLSSTLAQVIFEHHESCDGTGYPTGKSSDQLHPLGQIIALCDSLYALRFDPNHHSGRTLKDLQPYLNLNQEIHFYVNYQALTQLLKQANLTTQHTIADEDMQNHCTKLLETYQLLTIWGRVICDVVSYLPKTSSEKPIKTSLNILQSIKKIIRHSGLFNEGIRRWVQHVKDNHVTDAFSEMEEIGLMFEELISQMRKFYRQVGLIIEHECFTRLEHQENIVTCTGLMQQLNLNKIPESLLGINFDIEILMVKV
jgi:HD-GYP domain-containing protein (c-di-GMP phosphodiesterase class II)